MTKPIFCTGLRVLQIIPRLDSGGAEETTVEITQALARAGGKPFVACQGGQMGEAIEQSGGEVFHLPLASKNPLTIYRNIKRLRQLCIAMNIDIVHACSRALAWSGLFAAKQVGVPFLATYHSKVHASPRQKVFYNSVMTRGVKVIANSEFTAARIRDVHQTPVENIVTIPCGSDPARFDATQFSNADKQAQRADWGVKPDDVLIMCPARLTRWKGQEILLDALSKVLAANTQRNAPLKCKLVLVGGDQGRTNYTDRLKGQVIKAGLTDRVVFAGHVSTMPLAYAAADLVVLPSVEAEPFGRTAVEAQAAGVPVIASDDGGFCETVKVAGEISGTSSANSGANGWRVARGNLDALADTLTEALTMSKEDRQAMGARARQFVIENYTLKIMCDKTLQLYLDIMKQDGNKH